MRRLMCNCEGFTSCRNLSFCKERPLPKIESMYDCFHDYRGTNIMNYEVLKNSIQLFFKCVHYLLSRQQEDTVGVGLGMLHPWMP